MCLPMPGRPEDDALGGGLADLHSTRDLVVAEVRKAPKVGPAPSINPRLASLTALIFDWQRRVDNMITRLVDSCHLLHMHVTVR